MSYRHRHYRHRHHHRKHRGCNHICKEPHNMERVYTPGNIYIAIDAWGGDNDGKGGDGDGDCGGDDGDGGHLQYGDCVDDGR